MREGSSSNGRGALLVSNLPALQSLLKRDPKAYADEFRVQWQHYESQRKLIELGMAGKQAEERWRELVAFVAQVAPCYPVETADFPGHLTSMLLNPHAQVSADTRKALVQNLVLLRNRGVLGGTELLKVLFPLLSSTASSSMRTHLVHIIQSDLKRANAKAANHKLNRLVQGLLFDLIERSVDVNSSGTGLKGKAKAVATPASSWLAIFAVALAANLWRRGVWRDGKTVALIAIACLHPDTKVQSAAIHFFLAPPGSEADHRDSDEDKDDIPDLGAVQHAQKVGKTRRSNHRKLEKAKRKRKKSQHSATKDQSTPNFAALHLLNDPQGLVEKLYSSLARQDKAWTIEHRVLVMRLVGRLSGLHRLDVSSFYTYVTKYLTPHQLHITSILLCVAEATHEVTPPDVLEPVVQKIVHEFVHPGVANHVVAAGINAVSEICRRQHAVMGADLLADLTDYRKAKDKGVVTAARSLLQLFREVNPGLLRRRERGKAAVMGHSKADAAVFGTDRSATSGIDGLELLAEHLAAQSDSAALDDDSLHGWDAISDSGASEDSGGWMDVASDGDSNIYISDSDGDDTSRDVKRARVASLMPSDVTSQVSKAGTLASEKILTPADFAKLDELRAASAAQAAAGGSASARRKLSELKAAKRSAQRQVTGGFLEESDILGSRKSAKSTYEERMASIAEGRKGREKFGSRKGTHRTNNTSTTNKEKAKGKNFLMIAHSNSVRGKKFASLSQKQKRLRKHTLTQKGVKKFS